MENKEEQAEPSIEEILGSIRQIMLQSPAAQEEKLAQAAAQARTKSSSKDEVLELTEMVRDDGSVVDLKEESLERVSSSFAKPAFQDSSRQSSREEEVLVSSHAAQATAQAFQTLYNATYGPTPKDAAYSRSIEDLVRELLRPTLKEWLDKHLPALVERLVKEQINKISKQNH